MAMLIHQSKSEGQTGYHTECNTREIINENYTQWLEKPSKQCKKEPNSSQLTSFDSNTQEDAPKESKQLQTGIKLKLGAKIIYVPRTNELINNNHLQLDSNPISNNPSEIKQQITKSEIFQATNKVQFDEKQQTSIMKQNNNNDKEMDISPNHALSQANLFVSSLISLIYALHVIYWELIRANHTMSNTYENLEISLALCLLNLLPSLSMLMDIYAVILSLAVFIHVIWMAFHTLTVWSVELCYGAINDGCNAINLYRNITLCLQAVIICHQILLMITGIYQNKLNKQNDKIQTILTKASNLNINSDYEFSDWDSTEYVNNDNNKSHNDNMDAESIDTEKHRKNVLSLYPIDSTIRDNNIGIYSQTETMSTMMMHENNENEKISESAAEELGVDEVVRINQLSRKERRKLLNLQCKSVPSKLLKQKMAINRQIGEMHGTDLSQQNSHHLESVMESINGGLSESNEFDSDSTFEIYGVGSPKETHGKSLHKPNGLSDLEV